MNSKNLLILLISAFPAVLYAQQDRKMIASKTMMIFLILFLCYILLIFYKKIRRKAHRTLFQSDSSMPAHLWFYSKLVDMEIGTTPLSPKLLMKNFYIFLERFYNLSEKELQFKSIFDLVKLKEQDPEVLEFYGDLYNQINELPENSPQDIKEYIRKIKIFFNKKDVTNWIEQRNKNCNNC